MLHHVCNIHCRLLGLHVCHLLLSLGRLRGLRGRLGLLLGVWLRRGPLSRSLILSWSIRYRVALTGLLLLILLRILLLRLSWLLLLWLLLLLLLRLRLLRLALSLLSLSSLGLGLSLSLCLLLSMLLSLNRLKLLYLQLLLGHWLVGAVPLLSHLVHLLLLLRLNKYGLLMWL